MRKHLDTRGAVVDTVLSAVGFRVAMAAAITAKGVAVTQSVGTPAGLTSVGSAIRQA